MDLPFNEPGTAAARAAASADAVTKAVHAGFDAAEALAGAAGEFLDRFDEGMGKAHFGQPSQKHLAMSKAMQGNPNTVQSAKIRRSSIAPPHR